MHPSKVMYLLKAIIVFTFALFAIMFFVPSDDAMYMCALTGTRKDYKTWGGFTVKDNIFVSPLEKYMKIQNIPFSRHWVLITHIQKVKFFTLRGCGRAPEIYHFPYKFQTIFVKYATQEEVLHFINCLQEGNQKQREEAVRIAVDQAFYYWEKNL